MPAALGGESQISWPPELPKAAQSATAILDSTRVPHVLGQCEQTRSSPSRRQPLHEPRYVPAGSPSALSGPWSTGLPPPHPPATRQTKLASRTFRNAIIAIAECCAELWRHRWRCPRAGDGAVTESSLAR